MTRNRMSGAASDQRYPKKEPRYFNTKSDQPKAKMRCKDRRSERGAMGTEQSPITKSPKAKKVIKSHPFYQIISWIFHKERPALLCCSSEAFAIPFVAMDACASKNYEHLPRHHRTCFCYPHRRRGGRAHDRHRNFPLLGRAYPVAHERGQYVRQHSIVRRLLPRVAVLHPLRAAGRRMPQ